MFKHLFFWFNFQPGRVLTSQPIRWLKSWKWFSAAGRAGVGRTRCWQISQLASTCSARRSAVADAPAFFKTLLRLLVDGCPRFLCSFFKLFFTLDTCSWFSGSSEDALALDATAQHSATLRVRDSSLGSCRHAKWQSCISGLLQLYHVFTNPSVYLAVLALRFSPSQHLPSIVLWYWCPGHVRARDSMSGCETIFLIGWSESGSVRPYAHMWALHLVKSPWSSIFAIGGWSHKSLVHGCSMRTLPPRCSCLRACWATKSACFSALLVVLIQAVPAAPVLAFRATNQEFRHLFIQHLINLTLHFRTCKIPTLFDVKGQTLTTFSLCNLGKTWWGKDLSNSISTFSLLPGLVLRHQVPYLLTGQNMLPQCSEHQWRTDLRSSPGEVLEGASKRQGLGWKIQHCIQALHRVPTEQQRGWSFDHGSINSTLVAIDWNRHGHYALWDLFMAISETKKVALFSVRGLRHAFGLIHPHEMIQSVLTDKCSTTTGIPYAKTRRGNKHHFRKHVGTIFNHCSTRNRLTTFGFFLRDEWIDLDNPYSSVPPDGTWNTWYGSWECECLAETAFSQFQLGKNGELSADGKFHYASHAMLLQESQPSRARQKPRWTDSPELKHRDLPEKLPGLRKPLHHEPLSKPPLPPRFQPHPEPGKLWLALASSVLQLPWNLESNLSLQLLRSQSWSPPESLL